MNLPSSSLCVDHTGPLVGGCPSAMFISVDVKWWIIEVDHSISPRYITWFSVQVVPVVMLALTLFSDAVSLQTTGSERVKLGELLTGVEKNGCKKKLLV